LVSRINNVQAALHKILKGDEFMDYPESPFAHLEEEGYKVYKEGKSKVYIKYSGKKMDIQKVIEINLRAYSPQ
jgi:hypothetical protein